MKLLMLCKRISTLALFSFLVISCGSNSGGTGTESSTADSIVENKDQPKPLVASAATEDGDCPIILELHRQNFVLKNTSDVYVDFILLRSKDDNDRSPSPYIRDEERMAPGETWTAKEDWKIIKWKKRSKDMGPNVPLYDFGIE